MRNNLDKTIQDESVQELTRDKVEITLSLLKNYEEVKLRPLEREVAQIIFQRYVPIAENMGFGGSTLWNAIHNEPAGKKLFSDHEISEEQLGIMAVDTFWMKSLNINEKELCLLKKFLKSELLISRLSEDEQIRLKCAMAKEHELNLKFRSTTDDEIAAFVENAKPTTLDYLDAVPSNSPIS